MSGDHVVVHTLDENFTLSEGECFRTGHNGEIETSWYRIIIRYPESYEEHLYEAAHVRSNDTSIRQPIYLKPVALFLAVCSAWLAHILCEKYQYHTPID